MIDMEEEVCAKKVKEIYLLQGAQIEHYWDDIALALQTVPGFYDFYTSEWAYERAKTGHLQVWALSDGVIRAIVLTQLLTFPVQQVFEIMAATGVQLLSFVEEMQEVFERFAKQNNCNSFSIRARPGMARLLKKKFAFDEVSVTLRRFVRLQKDQ
jgi:hypothetical protein